MRAYRTPGSYTRRRRPTLGACCDSLASRMACGCTDKRAKAGVRGARSLRLRLRRFAQSAQRRENGLGIVGSTLIGFPHLVIHDMRLVVLKAFPRCEPACHTGMFKDARRRGLVFPSSHGGQCQEQRRELVPNSPSRPHLRDRQILLVAPLESPHGSLRPASLVVGKQAQPAGHL